MRHIYFKFKKSFLREQGLTADEMEKALTELGKYFEKAFKEHDFAYFKKRAIACLKKQYKELEKEEQENKNITKAFYLAEIEIEKAFPVGTIRTWKGKKFIKSPDKKWRPYYEKKGSQGEKLALAALAKKINALKDGDYEGLYKLLTLHRSRFTSDKNLINDLYNAMKEWGALGSGRFSKKEGTKTEKKPEKVEVKTEARERPKVEKKEGKESKEEKKNPKSKKLTDKEFEDFFESAFTFAKSKETDLGVIVSLGHTMDDLFLFSTHDSYGFKRIINQYLKRNGIYEEADLTDDKVLKCQAWLELATETAMNGKSIDSKISNRKLYEKNGIIITAEKRNDCWVLKGCNIGTEKEQQEKAEKAIQERMDFIKNIPSRDGFRKGIRNLMLELLNKGEGCFESVFKAKELKDIKCVIPKRLKEPLSEEKIIENLAFDDNEGGDEGGYCFSLALLYIAAKNGFDVLDKKGAASVKYFAGVAVTIVDGALDTDVRMVNDCLECADSAINLLDTIHQEDFGKQYLLGTGQHAAIIRKVDDGTEKGKLQYLELQGIKERGWTDFKKYENDKKCLKDRFGCLGSDRLGADPIAQMFDIDEISEKLKNKKYYNDFSKLLGYLNTKE